MKYELKSLTSYIRRQVKLGRGVKHVPHISIVYNPTPSQGRRYEKRLISDFISICSKYPLMEFRFNGYGRFRNSSAREPAKDVAMVKIDVPESILAFRWDLICRLRDYCELHPKFDQKRNDYSPHATLALNLKPQTCDRIENKLRQLPPPQKHYYLARATLLKNSKILCEYDFALRKSLNRAEALDKRKMRQTLAVIGERIEEKNGFRTGFQRNVLIGLGLGSILLAGLSWVSQGLFGLNAMVSSLALLACSVIFFYSALSRRKSR
ncbi:MAG: 2'-5' RNA ligase family protein [Dehalogenimonas sp.]|uniref:2'-5' RNA ligase family protein n=1 Tax=Candidatus Dehalogenimonas loeffleri TaxID=3127115 RepID=A0ABZ2J1U7_9CHLR|nr:2'-5' RNA ligase family protein [Dehalogenimonas sp.]